MSLSDNERQTIVRMEIEKAHKTFEDMEFCAHKQMWEAAANRLYLSEYLYKIWLTVHRQFLLL